MRGVNQILCAAALVLLSACASDKAPAEQAVKAAEAAVAEVKSDAAKWIPDQVQALDASLAAVKEKFAKGDYKAVLTEAPALAAKAKDVAAAATAKKAELTKAWDEMSAGLPKMVEAVKSRVDILSKSKRLPANVTKENFETAKADLADATKGWEDANAAFKGGNIADAVAKADAVKKKAVEALEALKMPVPPAAKS
ncbi:MAG TPA: hypothetical protein VIE44_07180 [Methylomirabilota bacterium]